MEAFDIFFMALVVAVPLLVLFVKYFRDDKDDDPDTEAKMFWWFGRKK